MMRLRTTLLAFQLAACFGQPSPVISLSNGVRLRITANPGNDARDDAHDPLKIEMKPATGNSVYRIFRDESGLAVYAYELVIQRLPDGDFRIVAKPAGEEFAAKFPYADGGKPTPTLPKESESPPLNPGGRFTIEIPTNPGLFEHRTDTVQVQPDTSSGAATPAAPMIRFVGLQVAIHGEPVPTNGPSAPVSGPYAMFFIPKRGGYFFSTQPVTTLPFVQAGAVDHMLLKFTIDNEDYECTASALILTQSERGQIWVYHDAHYKPAGNLTNSNPNPQSPDEFFTAAADSLNWWFP
jgi:hypothetical protein